MPHSAFRANAAALCPPPPICAAGTWVTWVTEVDVSCISYPTKVVLQAGISYSAEFNGNRDLRFFSVLWEGDDDDDDDEGSRFEPLNITVESIPATSGTPGQVFCFAVARLRRCRYNLGLRAATRNSATRQKGRWT